MKFFIILALLCLSFITQGQTNIFFTQPSIKKKRIKSILVQVYENKVHRFNHKYHNYKRFFDTSGVLTQEIIYKSSKDSIVSNFSYYRKENAQIQVILSTIKKSPKDSIAALMKNDSTFEIRRYLNGRLAFYAQNINDKENRLTKRIQILYTRSVIDIEPVLRFERDVENDTSIHSKIIKIDSSKSYVKEFFNNDKSNYSEGYIYYNKDRLIEKITIKDFYPTTTESTNSVELRFYDKNKNLIKIYRLFQEDFEKLQKNPDAKVYLIDSREYQYNERNMLIAQTVFSEDINVSFKNSTDRKLATNIIRKMSKLVITYGYEYW
jgi:hypothetical protein